MFQFIHSRLVNFVAKSNLPYIPFALSTISRIGCGRAIYTQRSRFKVKNMATSSTEHTIAIAYGEVRVEALVCNYGPLDWNTPRELYEDGVPAVCPAGTMRSTQYRALCRKCFLFYELMIIVPYFLCLTYSLCWPLLCIALVISPYGEFRDDEMMRSFQRALESLVLLCL